MKGMYKTIQNIEIKKQAMQDFSYTRNHTCIHRILETDYSWYPTFHKSQLLHEHARDPN